MAFELLSFKIELFDRSPDKGIKLARARLLQTLLRRQTPLDRYKDMYGKMSLGLLKCIV